MKISVIIPTYKRPDLLPKAIESALAQDGVALGRDYEIIVVSDADPCARLVAGKYAPHVAYAELPENRGQSAVLNRARELATGKYLVVQHDDDLMRPNKLAVLSAALDANSEAGIACALSGCVNHDGTVNTRHNDKRIERYRERGLQGPNLINQRYYSYVDGAATMYRRAMIDDLGGWNEALPHGEEVDIHVRACMRGWSIAFVNEVVADYRVHGEAVSGQPNKSLAPDGSGNLRDTAYKVGRKMRSGFRDDITVAISSIAERSHGLQRTVEALLPQCDRMNVYLVGYDNIPKFLDTGNGKLGIFLQDDYGQDRGSVEKFSWVADVRGYYVTCDDDVLYPSDYVERLVQGIERHGRKAVCGFHGSKLTRVPVEDYYRDRDVLHFRKALDVDTPVDVIGNVCGGFHTDTLDVTMNDFIGPHSQDDIWLTAAAIRKNVPRVCLRHPANWIQPNPAIDQSQSIYESYRNDVFMRDAIAATLNGAMMERITKAECASI